MFFICVFTGIFRDSKVNTMSDDVPTITSASAALTLTYYNKRVLVFHDGGCQLPAPFQCREIIENTNIFLCFLNILRARQNGRHLAYDTFKCIFLNENVKIAIKISLQFVSKGPINNIPELVQIMAWCRSGDKPLSEPMMASLLTQICVTRPQ